MQDSQQGLFGGLTALTAEFSELKQTNKDLALSLVMSRASSTFGKYLPLTRNWELYATKFCYSACPAKSELFLLYLQSLKAVATENGTRGSAVSGTVYAVGFAHKLRGLDRPGAAAAVLLLIGSTGRALGRHVTKKTAILKSEVTAMLDFDIPDFENLNWYTFRAGLFAVLAFYLEARFDDLIDLCPDSFFDYGGYIVVFVEHRKMDQNRQGEFVPIYDTGEPRPACALIRSVLSALAPADSALHIFRKIGTGKRGYLSEI